MHAFARSIWAARYSKANIFAMMLSYTSYFDASGKKEQKDHKETVVAGIVAPVGSWERFECDWKLALIKYGVPYFHMKEFIASQGAFKDPKWKSEGYRAQFLSVLVEIVSGVTLMTVARVLPHSLFDELNGRYKIEPRFNPYVICGLDCAHRVMKHIRKLYSDDAPIEYIFDQGDSGAGKLSTEMQRVGMPIPIFRYSKPVKNKPEIVPTIQLQAVDFIAWELRRVSATQDLPEFRQYRKSIMALNQMQQKTWKTYVDLNNFIKLMEIEPR